MRTKVRPYTKFQSTLPRGERLQPARERSRSQKFQSTLPRGERPPFEALNVPYIEFQSTLPRGERLNNGGNAGLAYEFQSTLPRGERPMFEKFLFPECPISIHAPARGATSACPCYHHSTLISIHAPARGATDRRSTIPAVIFDFNPRSREGSDDI